MKTIALLLSMSLALAMLPPAPSVIAAPRAETHSEYPQTAPTMARQIDYSVYPQSKDGVIASAGLGQPNSVIESILFQKLRPTGCRSANQVCPVRDEIDHTFRIPFLLFAGNQSQNSIAYILQRQRQFPRKTALESDPDWPDIV